MDDVVVAEGISGEPLVPQEETLADKYASLAKKFGVLQRIVGAQDDYIRELEERTEQMKAGPLQASGDGTPAAASAEELHRLRQENERLTDQVRGMRSTMMPSTFKADETAWQKEREELQEQVERFREVAEGLEAAVRRERSEKEDMALQAVRQMDTSLGRVQAEATAEVSRNQEAVSALRVDLERSQQAVMEREAQLAELRKALLAEIVRLREVCEKREAASIQEKEALRRQLDTMQRVAGTKEALSSQELAAMQTEMQTAVRTQQEREISFQKELSLLRGEVEALTKQAVGREGGGHPASDLQYRMLEERLHKALVAKEEAQAAYVEDKKELLGRLQAYKFVDDMAAAQRAKEANTRVAGLQAQVTEYEHRCKELTAQLAEASARVLETSAKHTQSEAGLKEELTLTQQEAARAAELAKSHQALFSAELEKERNTVAELKETLRHNEREWSLKLVAKDDDLADLESLNAKLKTAHATALQQQQAALDALRAERDVALDAAASREAEYLAASNEQQQIVQELRAAHAEATNSLLAAQRERDLALASTTRVVSDLRAALDREAQVHTDAMATVGERVAALQASLSDAEANLSTSRVVHLKQIQELEASSRQRLQQAREEGKTADGARRQAEAALSEERQAFAAERARLQQELTDMTAHRDKALLALEDARGAHTTDIDQLQSRLEGTREQLAAAEQSRSEAAARADALERQQSQLLRATKEQDEAVRDAREMFERKQRELGGLADTIKTQAEASRVALDAHASALDRVVDSVQVKWQHNTRLLESEHKRGVEERQAGDMALATQRGQLEAQEKAAAEEVAGLRGLKARLAQQVAERADEMSAAKARDEAHRKDLEARLGRFSEATEQVAASIADHSKRVAALHRQQADASADIARQADEALAAVGKQEEQLLQFMQTLKASTDGTIAAAFAEARAYREDVAGDIEGLRGAMQEKDVEILKVQETGSAERAALLADLQQLRARREADDAKVLGELRETRERWEAAVSEREEALRKEAEVAKKQVVDMRRIGEEREKLHVADMQGLQAAVAILKKMESEREALTSADKELVVSMMSKMQHHCESLQNLGSQERASLRTEIESLRRQLAERERTFNQHVQALRALHSSGTTPGQDKAAEALVAQVRAQTRQEVLRLQEETAWLRAELETSRREAEEREVAAVHRLKDLQSALQHRGRPTPQAAKVAAVYGTPAAAPSAAKSTPGQALVVPPQVRQWGGAPAATPATAAPALGRPGGPPEAPAAKPAPSLGGGLQVVAVVPAGELQQPMQPARRSKERPTHSNT